MLLTRYGHAALLIEIASRRILIDPGGFSAPETFTLSGLDAIVVTHQHADHLDRDRLPTLLAANPDALLMADPMTAAELGDPWLANRDGLITAIDAVRLRGVGQTHAEILPMLPQIANVGVVVEAPGEPTLFHPGDSYASIPTETPIDVLALPLGAPWAKVSETVAFARAVAPQVMLPVHDCTISEQAYGVYWGHVENHSGIPDMRRLGQRESTEVLAR